MTRRAVPPSQRDRAVHAPTSRRALFVCHEANVAPGYVGDAAVARGFTVEHCDIWADGLPDPGAHDLVVPLGSAASAYDDTVPWLAGELRFLRETVAADVPVFGICFGAQVLARALGGSVCAAERPEIGWFSVDSTAPEVVPAGPWLEWDLDTLTPPTGAETLARSASGVQAYQYGRTFGVQFHPEVSPEILASWMAGSDDTLTANGVDPGAFLRETQRRAPWARRAAALLFDAVCARLQVAPVH